MSMVLANISDWEERDTVGQPSCAKEAFIWICQRFKTTQNYIYLPSKGRANDGSALTWLGFSILIPVVH
jgi:hypothetical protein